MSDTFPATSVLWAGWPASPGVHALTTLRGPAGESGAPFDLFNLGDRCGDEPAAVGANRAALMQGLALPEAPRWLRQVHGTAVVRFESRDAHAPIEADAAVTSDRDVVLAVLTADCLPVVLVSRDGSEVAVAHAGWRGLARGVLEATVRAMHASPSQLIAWLGPAAGPQRYEIGVEVYRAFVDADPDAATAFVATRRRHWHVDLFALARRRLRAIGVEWVHGDGVCTIADRQRFFSHRRDGTTGRMATLAWIDAQP
ncbi:MAG: peptidoglycan editing factor PgeF [Lysobacterales bacterium]